MGGDSVVGYHETKSESEDSRGNCIQMLGTDQGNKQFAMVSMAMCFPKMYDVKRSHAHVVASASFSNLCVSHLGFCEGSGGIGNCSPCLVLGLL